MKTNIQKYIFILWLLPHVNKLIDMSSLIRLSEFLCNMLSCLEKRNSNICLTHMSVLSLSSGLLGGEVSVLEHIRIIITVTKVFSSKKGTFWFYSCRQCAIRCLYQRVFWYTQKDLRTWNLMLDQFLKCLFCGFLYFIFN